MSDSDTMLRIIVQQAEGGIYKRIDENRELLALLERDAPAFLQAHPWVIGWLQRNEDFLAFLAANVPVEGCFFQPNFGGPDHQFPRPSPLGEIGAACQKPYILDPNGHIFDDVRGIISSKDYIELNGKYHRQTGLVEPSIRIEA